MSSDTSVFKYDADQMCEEPKVFPQLVICFSSHGEMAPLEIAQTLRMSLPETPMFFVALGTKEFDKKKLVKNGFNDAFLFPWEKNELARAMKEEMLYSKYPAMRDFRPVKSVDIIPETELNFNASIFLSGAGKLVTLVREGEVISDTKLLKLKETGQSQLFVHKEDMEKFTKYTETEYAKHGRCGEPETIKEQRLKSGIRELVSNMFVEDSHENTFKKSQLLMDELKKTVVSLIDKNEKFPLKVLDNLINQEPDFYGHLSRVATYATLFATVLKVEKPVDVGLAGILHEIGLILLPPELMASSYEDLSDELKKEYQKYPTLSVDLIRQKRMVVGEGVHKAILHHKERLDGSGYPSQLKAKKVSLEGQILAIADEFDYATTLKDNDQKKSTDEVLNELISFHSADPVRMGIDIELLKKIKEEYIKGKNL